MGAESGHLLGFNLLGRPAPAGGHCCCSLQFEWRNLRNLLALGGRNNLAKAKLKLTPLVSFRSSRFRSVRLHHSNGREM